ncbi:MAG: Predicted L-lactate dehydrogenase, Fe-S oxidoreductase subunit YkgE, partial [uncultured Rubrobacteraceae bacterium]
ASSPVHHLLQRHPVPEHWPGDGRASGAPRPRGSLPRGADVLRTDALQHGVSEGGDPAGPPLRRRLQGLRRRGRSLRLLRRHGPRAVPHGREPRERQEAPLRGRGARGEGLRAFGVSRQKDWRHGRRGVLPPPRHLPPDLPLLEDAQGRGRAPGASAQRAGHGPRGAARGEGVLRLRGDVRRQERGHVRRDARGQAAPHPRHGGRDLHGRGQLVPDAHRRRPQAPARRYEDRPPRRDSSEHGGEV